MKEEIRCGSDWRIKLDCTDCTNKFKAGDLSFAHVLHLAECLGYELEKTTANDQHR